MGTMTPVTENFVFAATGTTVDHAIHVRGKFKRLMIKTPNFTNAVTTKLQIIDPDGDMLWDSSEEISFDSAAPIGAQNRNTTLRYALDEAAAIHRGWKLRAVLSGDAGGAGGTVKAVLEIEADQ